MWSWLAGKNGKRPVQGGVTGGAAGPGLHTGAGGDRPPHLRDLLPRISVEFERARRYERTVTVATFSASPGTARFAWARQSNNAPAALSLGQVLITATRALDLVACQFGLCLVVMPEIGAEEGRRAVSRMRQLCASRLGLSVTAGIAVFPQDGWVFLDLVDVAQQHARSEDVAQQHARSEDDDRVVRKDSASPNPSPL